MVNFKTKRPHSYSCELMVVAIKPRTKQIKERTKILNAASAGKLLKKREGKNTL